MIIHFCKKSALVAGNSTPSIICVHNLLKKKLLLNRFNLTGFRLLQRFLFDDEFGPQ